MALLCLIIVFLVTCSVTSSMTISEAKNYLMQFGYMNEDSAQNEAGMDNALSNFQKYAGLEQTGKLDPKTIEMMHMPRCGMPDNDVISQMLMSKNRKRKRRFSNYGNPWVTTVTYHIKTNSEKLESESVIKTVEKAFSMWEKYANVRFIKANNMEDADIVTSFERGEHGDGFAFNDTDEVQAHAFHPGVPKNGGAVHLKSTVNWTTDDQDRGIIGKTHLYDVALHEIGHSLGIGHSEHKDAVMYAMFNGLENFDDGVHDDDMKAIQHLYGKNPKDLCGKSMVDTMFVAKNSTAVFIGDFVWLLPRLMYRQFPMKIGDAFPHLPNEINAAFMDENNDYYFFKNHAVWKYKGNDLLPDFPKDISAEFPGIPYPINAALMWKYPNVKYFFFKDKEIYGFDRTLSPPVASRYPVDISSWNVPYPYDAVFTYNTMIYIVKNMLYYKLDLSSYKVKEGYPKSLSYNWFDC